MSTFPWSKLTPSNPGKVISNKDNVPLFSNYTIRGATLKNRIVVSPMCTYSSEDGFATDWHVVHLSQFALGGAALVFTEATGVAPEGRISPFCTGIWKDEHIAGWKRVTDSLHKYSALAGIQIGHAGRKASTYPPFYPSKFQRQYVLPEQGGWEVVGITGERFNEGTAVPHMLTIDDIKRVEKEFVEGAERAVKAGFDVIELHFAHGYLASTIYDPLVNTRTDDYGGSFENRTRFHVETVDAIRKVIPSEMPLFVRFSCVDGAENGWNLDDTVRLSTILKEHGVDVVDCSSGGIVATQRINPFTNYQVPYAEAVKKAGVSSMAVGSITEAKQAADIIAEGRADLVAIGRAFLHNPRWATTAAQALGVVVEPTRQYRWTLKDLPPVEFEASSD